MERSNNGSLNGRGAVALEEKPLSQAELSATDEVQAAPVNPELVVRTPESKVEVPEVEQDLEKATPPAPEPTPKKKNRKPLIFAIAGAGAIAASVFGYQYWSYASTHEETDNATTEVNRAQYDAAKAAIAQAEASLKDAQLQLSYTNIVAPSSGRIGRKTVEVGQRVQPGSPLMAIVESEYWVTANFKETQLKDIKPGQEVEIKLDAFPNHPFVGRVDSISPASGAQFALLPPDNATGNFTKVVQRIPVKVVFDPQSIQGYESRITPARCIAQKLKLGLTS
jgi:multidrug resistance efflux pump